MEEPRVRHDGQNIGQEIEQDEGHGEHQAAGLHHRKVALGDRVDEKLPQKGFVRMEDVDYDQFIKNRFGQYYA